MEVETSTTETIPEVPETPEKSTTETPEETTATEEKPKVEKIPIEAPKNNGVTTPAKPKQLSGIILQFPEMFSLKRDSHFLDHLSDAADIKFQKMAYIECESEEMAEALQAKLNNTTMNGKKINSSRLDCNEKNVLYINGLKREVSDDILKVLYTGIQKIHREGYNTFVLFNSETEARAAKLQINKDGISGQRVICEFDIRAKDRFKTEEPKPKKAKIEEEPKSEEKPEEEEAESKEGEEEKKEGEEEAKADGEEAAEEEMESEKTKPEEELKADEW